MFKKRKTIEDSFPDLKLFRNDEGKISFRDENGAVSSIFQKYVDVLKESARNQETFKNKTKKIVIVGASILGSSLALEVLAPTFHSIATMLTSGGAFLTIWGTLQNLGSRAQLKTFLKSIKKIESTVSEKEEA